MENQTEFNNIPNEKEEERAEEVLPADIKQEQPEQFSTLPVVVPKNELIEVEVEPHTLTPEQEMDEKANMIIAAATAAAATTCALPIPFADAPILVGQQVAMMASLCAVYHIDMKKNALRSIVLAVFGVGGTTIIGKTVFSSLIKLIPGAGSLLGGTLAAATGGSLTAALGKAWQSLCKDVLSGKIKVEELTSKENIKLLTTTMQNQLRLEMKKKDKPEDDVLTANRRPSNDSIIVTPYHPDEQVFITPWPSKSTLKETKAKQHQHEQEEQVSQEKKASESAETQEAVKPAETEPEPADIKDVAETKPESAGSKEAAEAKSEPAETKEAAEAKPEPAGTKEAAEAKPEPTGTKEAAEAKPEPAGTKEATEAKPEPADTKDTAETKPEQKDLDKATAADQMEPAASQPVETTDAISEESNSSQTDKTAASLQNSFQNETIKAEEPEPAKSEEVQQTPKAKTVNNPEEHAELQSQAQASQAADMADARHPGRHAKGNMQSKDWTKMRHAKSFKKSK